MFARTLRRGALAVLSALALGSLLPRTASAQDATDAASSPSLVTRDSYLVVTHVDMRKCAYPICGGYFVKSVNLAATRCADGTQQQACHAVQLNTNALGWTPE